MHFITALSMRNSYQGAFLGGVTACLVIIAISVALFLSGAFIGVAPWAIGATLLLIGITCLSVIPSLFSRIGRFIDGIKRSAPTPATRSSEQPFVSERCVPDSVDNVAKSHDFSPEPELVLPGPRSRRASDTDVFFRSSSNLIKMNSLPNLYSDPDETAQRTPEEKRAYPSRARSNSMAYDPSCSFFRAQSDVSRLKRTSSLSNLANLSENLGQPAHNLIPENQSISSTRGLRSA